MQVRGKRTSGSVLIVETSIESDVQKIMNTKAVGATLKCEPPKKRRPLMITTEDEIMKSVYELYLNLWRKRTLRKTSSWDSGLVPEEKHHVVEIDPELRKVIFETGPIICLGFWAVGVEDYLVVSRYNKCQDLGHNTKFCHQEEVCGHCGKSGHKKAERAYKSKQRKCIPCSKKGKQCSLGERGCATHKIMMDRLIDSTGYGL